MVRTLETSMICSGNDKDSGYFTDIQLQWQGLWIVILTSVAVTGTLNTSSDIVTMTETLDTFIDD